jgi:D-alanyl-D-alanine carboxypeptidase
MTNSNFVEPSGLDPENRASARDVAALIRAALSSPTINAIVSTREYSFVAKDGRPHVVRSTDELLGSFLTRPPYEFLGGKTGYLDEAGYCFGAAARDGRGNRLIAVVLGAPSKDQRFAEVKSLMYWAFDAFEWPAVPAKP